jgi:hypothetical protein
MKTLKNFEYEFRELCHKELTPRQKEKEEKLQRLASLVYKEFGLDKPPNVLMVPEELWLHVSDRYDSDGHNSPCYDPPRIEIRADTDRPVFVLFHEMIHLADSKNFSLD